LFILKVANIRCFIPIKFSEQEARFKKICHNVVIKCLYPPNHNWPPRHNLDIVESYIQHHKPDHYVLFVFYFSDGHKCSIQFDGSLELGNSNRFSSVLIIALMTPFTTKPWNKLNAHVQNTNHRIELNTCAHLKNKTQIIRNGGFLRVLRIPRSIKLTTTLELRYCWKCLYTPNHNWPPRHNLDIVENAFKLIT
jgi:hypothetical protein